MRFFHISDLHIGKQLFLHSLREEQEDVLAQIVERAKEYRPDAILISGDIYDRTVPSAEAYEMFDTFLNHLSEIEPNIPVLMIAGNHDNAIRLNYASTFLSKSKIYLSVMPPRNPGEKLKKITLEDEFGQVHFYFLPFTKPGYVRLLAQEEEGKEINSYDDAIRFLIEREKIDFSERNVLLAHQFFVSGTVTPEVCDSEQRYLSVGGVDSVDIEWVKEFDYVALGHIHGAQRIGKEWIRYSGTPLKYSVSEQNQKKGITMVTISEKGKEVTWETIPLHAIRDVYSRKGTLRELLEAAGDQCEDYVSLILTDENNIYRPKDQLGERYLNILEVQIDNTRSRQRLEEEEFETKKLSPFEEFAEFYEKMNGQPLSEEERGVVSEIIERVQEELE